MAQSILTPKTLWKDFDDTLTLKESVLSTNAINGVNLNFIYFSGPKIGNERVRIFGVYANNVIKNKGSILIIPDVNEQVDYELVLQYAREGYNVLSIDLQGFVKDKKDFTKYPDSISYANYEKSGDYMWYATKTAKQTSWYEWVSVCRYAISFLKEKSKNHKIGVLGIKFGSLIAFMLSATDKRVDCSCNLFGGGWLAYKGITKFSGKDIEINEERRRFLAGIDVQSYAQFITCPILFLACTNDNDFDVERSMDTLMRINNQQDLRYNFVTFANNVLDENCYNDTILFFEKYLTNKKVFYPDKPTLKVKSCCKDVYYTVSDVDSKNFESISVLYANYEDDPNERVWHKVENLVSQINNEYVFKRPNYENCDVDMSFVVVRYKNGLTISSKINYFKIDDELRVTVPSIIYSTEKYRANFLAINIKTQLLGGIFSFERLYCVDEGPFEIDGLFTKNTLLSYKIKEMANVLKSSSSLKFDFYTNVLTDLLITLTDKFGNQFFVECKFSGGELWRNVFISFSEFKSKDGLNIDDYSSLRSVSISSTGEFAINNFLLL